MEPKLGIEGRLTDIEKRIESILETIGNIEGKLNGSNTIKGNPACPRAAGIDGSVTAISEKANEVGKRITSILEIL